MVSDQRDHSDPFLGHIRGVQESSGDRGSNNPETRFLCVDHPLVKLWILSFKVSRGSRGRNVGVSEGTSEIYALDYRSLYRHGAPDLVSRSLTPVKSRMKESPSGVLTKNSVSRL